MLDLKGQESAVSDKGLDLDFAAGKFRVDGDDLALEEGDLAPLIKAVPALAFSRNSMRTAVDANGDVVNVAPGALAIDHDLGTGANPRASFDPPGVNLIRNPSWAELSTGPVASGAPLARDGMTWQDGGSISSVVVSTGIHLGMTYAEFEITADDAKRGTFRLVYASASGKNAIPVKGNHPYKLWVDAVVVSGADATHSLLWRIGERDDSNTMTNVYAATYNLHTSGPERLVRIQTGYADYVTHPGTTKIQPLLQMFVQAGRTVVGSKNGPGLLDQTAAPKYLMGQICTREAGQDEVELALLDLQAGGRIKIYAPHYALYPIRGFKEGENLHWNGDGSRLMGIYRARAMMAELYGQGWWPTMPVALLPPAIRPQHSVRVVGNTVEVDFVCPGEALALYDAAMDNPAQGGLRYTRASGGSLAITGYAVRGKTLVVTCAGTPTRGVLGFADFGQPTSFQDGPYSYPLASTPRTVVGDNMAPPNYCLICRVPVTVA